MKEEYDFTNAEQGKFYRPIEELEIPICLDKEVKEYFFKNIKSRDSQFSLNTIVNSLIKKYPLVTRHAPEYEKNNEKINNW